MQQAAQDLLLPLPEKALRRASRALAAAFGRTLLISTLHDGERLETADEATRDDLAALADALPPGRLSFDLGLRDAASSEPRMLTMIRQAEGTGPKLPAVLLASDEHEAQSLLAEASAAGFEPNAPAKRRSIGLSFAPVDSVQIEGDEVSVGAGTEWHTLEAAAEEQGLGVPAAALSGRYERPADAGAAGLFPAAEPAKFRGELQSCRFRLPPAAVGATDRSWLVPADVAAGQLEEIVALYAPLYAEVLCPTDAILLHAAGLLARRPDGRAILRVVFEGTRGVRRAAANGADRQVRRNGGRLCQRGPIADEAQILALAATSGAARLELRKAPATHPPGAVTSPVARAVRGDIERSLVIWYPRDLARSIDQANELLNEPDTESAPTTIRTDDDEGWEALRAALAEALP